MRRWRWLIYMILILLILAVVILFFLPSILGIKLAVVYSGSMEPVMPAGALALMESVDPSQVKVGDIIAFNSVHDPDTTVSHRVVEVLDEGLSLAFRTKGDANEDPDPLSVPAANILGRVSFNIPYAGNGLARMGDYTKSRLGFALLICIPTFLLVGIATRDLNLMLNPAKRRQRKLKERKDRRNKRRFGS